MLWRQVSAAQAVSCSGYVREPASSLRRPRCAAQADRWRGASAAERPHRSSEVLAVQTAAALCAGCTSATLTNPLDVVKTRLQVSAAPGQGPLPCIRQHRQRKCSRPLDHSHMGCGFVSQTSGPHSGSCTLRCQDGKRLPECRSLSGRGQGRGRP